MIRRILLTLLLLALPIGALADEVTRGDAATIRAVISEQLDAFRRDDGPRAFSLATAGIRAQFGTPEAFMQMVRSGYPVVYRPRSVSFETPELIDGTVIQ